MLVVDLRWLLFGLLLLLIVVVAAALWLDRWRSRRQQRGALPGLEGLRPVWEVAPLGLLILDDTGACRYANPYARRLLGLEAASGRLPDAGWGHLLDMDRLAARSEIVPVGRYRTVVLGEGQFVQWWLTPWRDWTLVFLLDMTTPHRVEQAARFLLSDLSHELRTPLATLLTHLEVLRLPHVPDETRQQSIYLMQVEARRMARLVHDMLELGRLETSAELERRPVDLLAVVEAALAQVRPQAEAQQIALSLQADTPLPLVVGDADRLKQVFLNLLDNAVKYSRPGDRVIVSLQSTPAGDGVACAVCDTGPGIPAEHLPHVTRRFYRAVPDEMEGSGLGLAIVTEILRRHQSRLDIESRSEGAETGTCTRFVLPALPEEGT